MKQLQRGVSSIVTEKASSFVAQAYTATNINKVRQAYKHVLTNPTAARATHVIMAYRIGEEEGWVDDEEHGAGHFLTTWLARHKLCNIAIFITRQYGGQHLATRRFELMREVATEACKNLGLTI